MAVVRLFVRNLAYDATEEDLRTLFSKAGKPTIIDIIKEKTTGDPRGIAFVTLDLLRNDPDYWRETVQGEEIRGRRIHVDVAFPRGTTVPK